MQVQVARGTWRVSGVRWRCQCKRTSGVSACVNVRVCNVHVQVNVNVHVNVNVNVHVNVHVNV